MKEFYYIQVQKVSPECQSVRVFSNSEVNSVRKHNYNCMLDYDVYWQVNNYMFRPVAAIFRLLQFCSKSVIYIYIAQSVIYIYIFAQSVSYIYDTDFHRTVHGFFFWGSMPSHIVVDFVVLPPGHGRSVTDF